MKMDPPLPAQTGEIGPRAKVHTCCGMSGSGPARPARPAQDQAGS